ncbi:MAG TPA: NifB/NifX family molybdenum-iron cluster-binding protein [Thermodesulfobacteriota bacterium]|nr:NifB/NifX family molybdenum-iron cluster-binding protein [Deltaproteobacteria bacterium]HOC39250.1 NifB/NifX family molybdenum-iron cluster-binding protein [Thermodesulfobacteriota bacterium]
MKRIGFASENDSGLQAQISMHFGRCPYYTLVDVDGEAVKAVNVVANPYFNNHTPGVVPRFIHSQGANVMIAGGMGPRAIDLFTGFGIEVATGVGGQAGNVLEAYLAGKVQGIVACSHDHDHEGEHCQH